MVIMNRQQQLAATSFETFRGGLTFDPNNILTPRCNKCFTFEGMAHCFTRAAKMFSLSFSLFDFPTELLIKIFFDDLMVLKCYMAYSGCLKGLCYHMAVISVKTKVDLLNITGLTDRSVCSHRGKNPVNTSCI